MRREANSLFLRPIRILPSTSQLALTYPNTAVVSNMVVLDILARPSSTHIASGGDSPIPRRGFRFWYRWLCVRHVGLRRDVSATRWAGVNVYGAPCILTSKSAGDEAGVGKRRSSLVSSPTSEAPDSEAQGAMESTWLFGAVS